MVFSQTYVQDLMQKEAKMIYELIAVERGHFYVCGDCKMAENVYQTLKSIIQEQTGMNSTQSDNFMLGLRVSLRLAIYGSRKYLSFFFSNRGVSRFHVLGRYSANFLFFPSLPARQGPRWENTSGEHFFAHSSRNGGVFKRVAVTIRNRKINTSSRITRLCNNI